MQSFSNTWQKGDVLGPFRFNRTRETAGQDSLTAMQHRILGSVVSRNLGYGGSNRRLPTNNSHKADRALGPFCM